MTKTVHLLSFAFLSFALLNCSVPPEQRVQWFAVGDSITYGWHGGKRGGPGSGTTYPERALVLLNAPGAKQVDLVQEGYPSKTAAWYMTDTAQYHGITPIQHTIGQFDRRKYGQAVVTLFFGANDLTNQDNSRTSHTPSGVYRYFQQAATALHKAGATVIVAPVMNRTDSYATPTFDQDRLALDNMLIAGYPAFAADVVNLPAIARIYPSASTTDTTLFVDQVHPTARGDELLGLEFARAVARQTGIKLKAGNGTTPKPTTVQ